MEKLVRDVSPYLVVLLLVMLAGASVYIFGGPDRDRMDRFCSANWRDYASDSVEDYAEFRSNPTRPDISRLKRSIRQEQQIQQSAPKQP